LGATKYTSTVTATGCANGMGNCG